jgi:hypothetical protein
MGGMDQDGSRVSEGRNLFFIRNNFCVGKSITDAKTLLLNEIIFALNDILDIELAKVLKRS